MSTILFYRNYQVGPGLRAAKVVEPTNPILCGNVGKAKDSRKEFRVQQEDRRSTYGAFNSPS